jgi:hypothetical protein
MSTHTLTKIGMINNDDNKQIIFAIMMLEKALHDKNEMYTTAEIEGLTAFLPDIHDDMRLLHHQLTSLLTVLTHNIDQLIK